MAEFFIDGASLLRIYTAEKDQINGIPLYEWIVQRAVTEGLSGFQINQPVIVEIVDTEKTLEEFIRKIDPQIKRGLMTLSPVKTRYYGKN